MATDNRRADRVADAIREEVATFLAEDVKDPRITRTRDRHRRRGHARPPPRQSVRQRDGHRRRARGDVRGSRERRGRICASRVGRALRLAPRAGDHLPARREHRARGAHRGPACPDQRRQPPEPHRTAGMATPTTESSGLLLVDKPAGITSHDVVAIVRRALRTRRVGHAGTLDPFATGLLVVLVGRGTRLIPYIDGEPKVYEATIRFGAETDTDDRTGRVTRTRRAADRRRDRRGDRAAHRRRSTRCRRRIPRSRSTARARTPRRGAATPLDARSRCASTVHRMDAASAATADRRRGAHHVRRRHVHSRARARPRPTHGQRRAPRRASPHRSGPFAVERRGDGRRHRERASSRSGRSRAAIPSTSDAALDADELAARRAWQRDRRRASTAPRVALVDDEEDARRGRRRARRRACGRRLVLRDA